MITYNNQLKTKSYHKGLIKALFMDISSVYYLYRDVKRGRYFYKDISGVIVLPCDIKGSCEYYNMVTGDFYRCSFLHILYLRSNENACRR